MANKNTRLDILDKKDSIIEWLNEGKSFSEIIILLDCKMTTLRKYLKILDLKSKTTKNFNIKMDLSFYLRKNIHTKSSNLKFRLIKEGLKEHKCEKCKKTRWLNQRIPIELHHIDGDNTNNLLENLQILCPNCHALTDNFTSKNLKSNNRDIKKDMYCDCGNLKTAEAKKCLTCYGNQRSKIKSIEKTKKVFDYKKHFCVCGKSVRFKNTTCRPCYNLTLRTVERPLLQILIKDIRTLGYSATGRKYGVSDNAIRKWLKHY